MPTLLVLSANNKYTGLIKINIRYDKNEGRENFSIGGWVLFKLGAG